MRKKQLQKELESKIRKNEELKDELSRIKAKGCDSENAERIKYLNGVIAEHEGEICKLKKTIRQKNKEIEKCHIA